MAKRQGVMVAIPTMTNRITIQISAFLDALREAARDPEIDMDVSYTIEYGRAPVEFARNILCGAFLRTDCTHLFFIDEDMLPNPNCIRLLHSQADITAARMYKFDHPNPVKGMDVGLGLCAMTIMPNGLYRQMLPEIGSPAVQECDVVGTGCTVIRRHVLEDRRLWATNIYKPVDGPDVDGNIMTPSGDYAPNIFQYKRGPNGVGIMGEDVDFCERAKALGYKIVVDLNAECGHFKQIDIDQAGYLAQKTLQRAVAGIKLEDGRIIKANLSDVLKDIAHPPADKMIHAGDFAVKAV